MWLDRFSGHSGAGNPAPFQRQASPIPRQSQHNAGNPPSRPPFNKRSSSLSLASVANASTSSLAGSLRPGNAPLGKSTPAATPGTDPVEVLQGIIGNKGQLDEEPCSSSSDTFTVAKPEQLVKAIDFRDRSLEQFAYQNNELMEFPNDSLVSQSADQYEKEKQRFQELHGSIAGCDDVLKSVEAYLLKFQAELSAVSAEIETLQSRSTHLGSQLENRKNVEQLLGPAVEGIAISPRTVRMISEGPINSDWIQALNELECHSASVEADSVKNVKAVEDVKPLLLDLKNKAVERIRDYLVAQIRAIRSPNINAQILQQQSLARYKEIYSFLSRHQPQLAEEILLAYVNTMKWYNLSNFTRYNQALDKLKIHFMDRNDLLGGETASQKSSHPFPSVRNLHSSHDPFTLGRRIDILKSSSPMALSSYLAEEDKSYHGVEVPFRNFNLALIDNISAEFSFMTETFAAKSVQQASRRVVAIFEPIFNLGHNLTKQLIENTADCLGILLCVRLNQQFAFELQRRKVPVADSYINGINMLLWPRFQIVMDMHHESLKRVASSSRGNISALSLTGGDKQSLAPHFLTQRFGQFLHSILQLSSEAGDNEPISNSLGRLTTEFEALLTKLSKACGEAKRKERFLFNNYSLLLTIISDTEGKLAEEQQTLHDDKVSDIGLRSQVIHAGLYYGHDTLKTTLCIKGRELLYSLCRKHDIPHRNTGKWIVAQDDGQWAECQKVHSHAQSIGVPTHFVGRQEAQRREPDVRAQAGILESPTTGIVDSHALMTFLHGDFEDRGGDCVLKTEVIDIEPLDSGKEGYKIFTKSHSGEEDSVTTEVLVNCAGLYACDISNMVLPKTRHRVPYFTKGSYFSYSASQPRPNILLYPAPKPGLGGLGTHLTLDMTGRVRFGPDVEWIDNPNDFKPNPARLQEAIPEIQAFLPGVDVNAIGTDYCGIRPKLSNMASVVKAKGFQDFVIQREEGFPGFINLLGIESPGLTSSLAIGEMVEGLVYR
ncbi:Vacuolar protein sorting-associated protein 52 [Ophidiomyces ophidiicola]|uniref:Vacuolar protein sorting-associated protein 52 n=1 Tax=Ophidiomyces ophidiicola TaxID=1387563 RepID=A0ACB8V3P8_9EURO|nr:Vacuolar protein sorting-associated protein 52 [Ophidiomyces ophidiicola]KAI1930103.1 Vacuolar protein sorting-associated protein 52 [Ophidiomyces ophidiicola]KAI1965084.1 Vacuolar protein sorting-associated protein 52 [Ophidiomyces ophidiicola]KAI2016093.1 Vacuolar protein sorting-associated protein 52 [Ophidiomyces ophidiicola]KAI2038249.1 Vacuolar protein sorting-associated protein 52 [Ophidiomyces ophidiicola]